MTHLTKAEIQAKLDEFAKEYAQEIEQDETVQITLVEADGTESDLIISATNSSYVI